MLQSSLPIVVVIPLGVLGIIGMSAAIDIELGFGIGSLLAAGCIIGRWEDFSWWEDLRKRVSAGSPGLAVLALDILVH